MQFVEGELVSEYVGLKYFDVLAKDPIAGIAIKNTAHLRPHRRDD